MSELLKEEIEVNWPEQKVQRLASGDKLDQSREVVYYAYFKGAVKAARAQVDLEDIGFKTEAEGGFFKPTMVAAKKEHDLKDETVARVLTEVIGVVEKLGGEFDGFVAVVVD
jgi:Regulator of ribonuclease activity B